MLSDATSTGNGLARVHRVLIGSVAQSSSADLRIGTLRTAVLAWLFARSAMPSATERATSLPL